MTYGIASLEIFLSALDDDGFPRLGGITCTYAVGILENHWVCFTLTCNQVA